ncbi:hypothetical protein PhCBS80983_g02634 [Powellomyces hirtus]|uniref:Mitochondrial adapter protein MCP1 transmembrane domain-containing protein n=1 Tax=Powellomyces hirtus TaxID=109895 RepID=A0A507E504_9FUNG|nr:hypothetical protein PhCBS80983_g02634 [Powellomyces hirtus]
MDAGKVDRILAVIQQTSGLLFSSFSVLHLSGHLLATFSFAWADAALYTSRVFYQNPIVEPLVIGVALCGHIGSSVARILIRLRRQKNARTVKNESQRKEEPAPSQASAYPTQSVAVKELRWHRYTGYVLTAFIGGHLIATRLTPINVFDDPPIVDLTWITTTLNGNLRFLFFPYYAVFGTAGIYHTAYGIQQSVRMLRMSRKSVKPGTWTKLMYTSGILMTTALLAIAGTFETIPIPLASKWKELDDGITKAALGLLRLS